MNPDEGSRQLIVNPEDEPSSPFGWHSDGTQDYATLRGNNEFVTIADATSNEAVATSPSLIFSYPYSPATADWQAYVNASATQASYTINQFHDILYTLGFDEAAGNFQTSNNGKGGRAGGPVNIIIQSSTGSATMTNVGGWLKLTLDHGRLESSWAAVARLRVRLHGAAPRVHARRYSAPGRRTNRVRLASAGKTGSP